MTKAFKLGDEVEVEGQRARIISYAEFMCGPDRRARLVLELVVAVEELAEPQDSPR